MSLLVDKCVTYGLIMVYWIFDRTRVPSPFVYIGRWPGRGEDGIETINGATQIVGQSLEHHSPSKY